MNNNIDNSDIAPESLTDGGRDNPFPVMQGIKLTSPTFFPQARKWMNGRKPGAQ